jgi:hypothetical protein
MRNFLKELNQKVNNMLVLIVNRKLLATVRLEEAFTQRMIRGFWKRSGSGRKRKN